MFCILKPDFIDEVENYKGFIFISDLCDQKFLNPVNQEKNCLAFHFDRVITSFMLSFYYNIKI